MVIFLRLRKLIRNCACLCSTLILGTLLYESWFVSWMKVLVDIMSFSYWGFISHLEFGSERYGFSNANHQSVTWVNAEIETFENIFRSFYIIMGITRKLQSVLSSTSLLVYRSLFGLKTELHEYENEISEVSTVMIQVSVYQIFWGYLSFYEPHNTPHGINHSIILFRSFTLSFIHFRDTANHVLFISIKIFSLLLNHFHLVYFTSICCISSSITLTDLIYYLKCTSYVSHFITQFLLHIFLLTQLGE